MTNDRMGRQADEEQAEIGAIRHSRRELQSGRESRDWWWSPPPMKQAHAQPEVLDLHAYCVPGSLPFPGQCPDPMSESRHNKCANTGYTDHSAMNAVRCWRLPVSRNTSGVRLNAAISVPSSMKSRLVLLILGRRDRERLDRTQRSYCRSGSQSKGKASPYRFLMAGVALDIDHRCTQTDQPTIARTNASKSPMGGLRGSEIDQPSQK